MTCFWNHLDTTANNADDADFYELSALSVVNQRAIHSLSAIRQCHLPFAKDTL